MSVQHSPNVNEIKSISVNWVVQNNTKTKFLPLYFKRFLRAAKFTGEKKWYILRAMLIRGLQQTVNIITSVYWGLFFYDAAWFPPSSPVRVPIPPHLFCVQEYSVHGYDFFCFSLFVSSPPFLTTSTGFADSLLVNFSDWYWENT